MPSSLLSSQIKDHQTRFWNLILSPSEIQVNAAPQIVYSAIPGLILSALLKIERTCAIWFSKGRPWSDGWWKCVLKARHCLVCGLYCCPFLVLLLTSSIDERSLGIHVFYISECPGSYDVPGFAASQDDTVEYPRTSYWERTRRFIGSVDSGFHTYVLFLLLYWHLLCFDRAPGLTYRRVGLRVNSLLSTSPGGEAHFPSAEEANDHAVLRSDEVGIPTLAQTPLDVVGEIYLSTDESTASDTDGKYVHICFTMLTCYIMKVLGII